jgi:hypothetical protein
VGDRGLKSLLRCERSLARRSLDEGPKIWGSWVGDARIRGLAKRPGVFRRRLGDA